MSKYTVRVVLHDATLQHYLKLYPALAKYGFTDVIVGDNGTAWKMPPGEYDIDSTLTAVQVRDLAKRAADTTGCKNAVFVTAAGPRAWIGLDTVPKSAAA